MLNKLDNFKFFSKKSFIQIKLYKAFKKSCKKKNIKFIFKRMFSVYFSRLLLNKKMLKSSVYCYFIFKKNNYLCYFKSDKVLFFLQLNAFYSFLRNNPFDKVFKKRSRVVKKYFFIALKKIINFLKTDRVFFFFNYFNFLLENFFKEINKKYVLFLKNNFNRFLNFKKKKRIKRKIKKKIKLFF